MDNPLLTALQQLKNCEIRETMEDSVGVFVGDALIEVVSPDWVVLHRTVAGEWIDKPVLVVEK